MATVSALPKDLSKLNGEVKLFGKWDTQECVLGMAMLCAHSLTNATSLRAYVFG